MKEYTTQQIALRLGVKLWNISNWKRKGWIPQPEKIGWCNVYTRKQYQKIKADYQAGVFNRQGSKGLSVNEVAAKLGIAPNNLYWWRKQGFISKGEKIGRRYFYSTEEVKRMRADIESGALWQKDEKGKRYFNQNETAKYCGVSRNSLAYMISVGKISAPSHGGLVKKYAENELPGLKEEISRAQQAIVNCGDWTVDLVKAGYFSIKKAAPYLKMPLITFHLFLKNGRIPRPTHQLKRGMWYTKGELDRIKNSELRSYFAERKKKLGA